MLGWCVNWTFYQFQQTCHHYERNNTLNCPFTLELSALCSMWHFTVNKPRTFCIKKKNKYLKPWKKPTWEDAAPVSFSVFMLFTVQPSWNLCISLQDSTDYWAGSRAKPDIFVSIPTGIICKQERKTLVWGTGCSLWCIRPWYINTHRNISVGDLYSLEYIASLKASVCL